MENEYKIKAGIELDGKFCELTQKCKEISAEKNYSLYCKDEELSKIERDLEITMGNDFDELERIILNEIDLSNKTVQWLYDILHKDMNLFFKHIMQRLGNKNYL